MLKIDAYDLDTKTIRVRIDKAYWRNDLHRILTCNAAAGGIITDGDPCVFRMLPESFLRIYKIWGDGSLSTNKEMID